MILEVLIPVRNPTEVFEKTVESLAAQTDKNFSVLISDNFSTRGSELFEAALKKLSAAGIAARKIQPPAELGRVEHWNWLHQESKADWFKPLFAGDWLEPIYIARLRETPTHGRAGSVHRQKCRTSCCVLECNSARPARRLMSARRFLRPVVMIPPCPSVPTPTCSAKWRRCLARSACPTGSSIFRFTPRGFPTSFLENGGNIFGKTSHTISSWSAMFAPPVEGFPSSVFCGCWPGPFGIIF